eukprot:TRINITY_DN7113_c0_g1_i1.p1 TRINITY_DN7113_c0_g1~~TRINITY_DN7113_c0_g1_i1.p1  ORF type:complete len:965 (-),score=341.08 TRINITY_DN7113_c0_g1_i1:103-2997(-)
MEEVIKSLAFYLTQTCASDQARKQGEEGLAQLAKQPQFALYMLKLLGEPAVEPSVKQIGAIVFKNFIKDNWPALERISVQERNQVKTTLVSLMLTSPAKIQAQLSASISLIAKYDFPAKWPTLLPELVGQFQATDWMVINGALYTTASIFKQYASAIKSDEVLLELKYVLGIVQEPLTRVFLAANQFLQAQAASLTADLSVNLFMSIKFMVKIFFYLNSVDLPEYFEDHMTDWFTGYRSLLTYSPPATLSEALLTPSDDKPGLLHKIHTHIIKCLNLYLEKYEEEFTPFMGTFLQDVWGMIVKAGDALKMDNFVNMALKFLNIACTGTNYTVFANEDAIRNICRNIVVPNMQLRECDEEMFEDEPREYVKLDMEGSDTATRRRAAAELVKALRKNFEKEVTALFEADIGAMLQNYAASPAQNWKSKDVAIFLLIALAVKAAATSRGTSKINTLVPIADFYKTQVLPELANFSLPAVIRADCIKYVFTFRLQLTLTEPEKQQLFSALTRCLGDKSAVVQMYAAATIERLLALRDKGNPRYSKEFLCQFAKDLLAGLSASLRNPDSSHAENEYFMKAMMRVLSSLKESVVPYAIESLQLLVQLLGQACANVRNPQYNHFMFEAIAATAKNALAAQPAMLPTIEGMLQPAIQTILQKEITEFSPYAFQLLALLIDASTQINASYLAILPSLLVPALWDRSANVPALVRLLQAYIRRATAQVADEKILVPVLGVYQKLLNVGSTDHEAFFLLDSLFLHVGMPVLQRYVGTIFTLIFTRLSAKPTIKLQKSFAMFIATLFVKHGPETVAACIESVQAGLSAQVIDSLFLGNLQKIQGRAERKTCTLAATRLACDWPAVLANLALWVKALIAAHRLIADPLLELTPEDEDALGAADVVTSGSTTSYQRLAHTAVADDPFLEVPDAKQYFVVALHRLLQAHRELVPQLQQALPANVASDIAQWFAAAGLSL